MEIYKPRQCSGENPNTVTVCHSDDGHASFVTHTHVSCFQSGSQFQVFPRTWLHISKLIDESVLLPTNTDYKQTRFYVCLYVYGNINNGFYFNERTLEADLFWFTWIVNFDWLLLVLELLASHGRFLSFSDACAVKELLMSHDLMVHPSQGLMLGQQQLRRFSAMSIKKHVVKLR